MKAETKPEGKHSSSTYGFSTRLREIESGFKNRAEISEAIGVAKSSYQRWVDGKSIPSFMAMAKLAEISNVSLDWLAFGKGAPSADGQPAKPAEPAAPSAGNSQINKGLMCEIYNDIQRLAAKHGKRFLPEHHIDLACDIYNTVTDLDGDTTAAIRKYMALVEATLKVSTAVQDCADTVQEEPETKRSA